MSKPGKNSDKKRDYLFFLKYTSTKFCENYLSKTIKEGMLDHFVYKMQN